MVGAMTELAPWIRPCSEGAKGEARVYWLWKALIYRLYYKMSGRNIAFAVSEIEDFDS